VVLSAANVHDSTLLERVVDAVPAVKGPRGRPGRPRKRPTKLHGDKGVHHEVLPDLVGWKDPPLCCRSSPVEAGGSPAWEAPGRWE
jgi:hypothetical protein